MNAKNQIIKKSKILYTFENKKYPIIIKEKVSKKISLKLDSKNRIICISPYGLEPNKLNLFFQKNIIFIIREMEKRQGKKPFNLDEKWCYIWGKKYYLEYKNGKSFTILDNTIIIKGKSEKSAFNNFIKQKSKEIIILFNNIIAAEKIDAKVVIKNLSSTWGICNNKTKIISLSRRLIFLPVEACRYVIYHELAHLKHPNHSQQFWNEVSIKVPNFRQLKTYLNIW